VPQKCLRQILWSKMLTPLYEHGNISVVSTLYIAFILREQRGRILFTLRRLRAPVGKFISKTRYLLTASPASQPAISFFSFPLYELLMNVYLIHAVRISLFK
jgi:hypothetical protein